MSNPKGRYRQPRAEKIANWAFGLVILVSTCILLTNCAMQKINGQEPFERRVPWKSTFAALRDTSAFALPGVPAAVDCACGEVCHCVEAKKEPVPTPATPSLEDRETTWTKYLAAKNGWRDDVVAWDGSLPDLVTPCYAIELDWAKHKWKEAIGQAFDYAATMQRRPAVLLLVKDRDDELKDLYRAERACRTAGVLLLIYDCKRDRWLLPVIESYVLPQIPVLPGPKPGPTPAAPSKELSK